MRRAVGVGSLQRQNQIREEYKKKGDELETLQIAQLQERLDFFKKNLEEFAAKHKKDINRDPEFRHHFQQMCAKIGVDPLASKKGFWAELLGVGDFYYELSVQLINVCIATRSQNGGIIEIDELTKRLQRKRSANEMAISKDDILQAMSKIKILGSGFELITMRNKTYVKSVPCELTKDHTDILQIAQENGGTIGTAADAARKLVWTTDRVEASLLTLLKEGLAWIDDQYLAPNSTGGFQRAWWFPGLIDQSSSSS